jgi:hypothetical protein
MARADTVSLTYTADLSDLKKQLASIPGITAAEARKAVNELNRTNKALLRNQDKVAKGTRQTDRALKDLGDTAGDSESSLRAMGGVLGLLSPEAERAVAAIAELGGGLEGVTKGARVAGVSLNAAIATAGLVGVAVVAAAAAYTSMSQEMERAAAHAEFMREVNDSLEPSIRRVEDAELALAVALGQVSEAQADSTARALEAQRAVEDFAKAQREQRAELSETIETNQRYLDVLDSLGLYSRPLTALGNAVFGFSDSIEQATGELATLDKALQTNAKNQKTARKLTDNAADAKSRNEASTRRQTKAIRDEAAAIAQQAAADRAARSEEIKGIQDAAAAREQLATLTAELSTGGDEGAQRELAINQQLAARVALLDQIAAQVGHTAEVEQAFFDIQADHQRQLEDLAKERAEKERAMMLRNAQMQMSAFSTLYGGMADAAKVASDRIGQSNKKGAMVAFRAYQASAISQAIINGAVAVTQSFAQLGPVAGAIAAVGVGLATAAQVAVIASEKPSFNDTPAAMYAGSTGLTARFAPGDHVIAAQNPREVQRQADALTGDRAQPQVVVAPIATYRHFTRVTRDELRRPSPLSRAVRSERSTGQLGW